MATSQMSSLELQRVRNEWTHARDISTGIAIRAHCIHDAGQLYEALEDAPWGSEIRLCGVFICENGLVLRRNVHLVGCDKHGADLRFGSLDPAGTCLIVAAPFVEITNVSIIADHDENSAEFDTAVGIIVVEDASLVARGCGISSNTGSVIGIAGSVTLIDSQVHSHASTIDVYGGKLSLYECVGKASVDASSSVTTAEATSAMRSFAENNYFSRLEVRVRADIAPAACALQPWSL